MELIYGILALLAVVVPAIAIWQSRAQSQEKARQEAAKEREAPYERLKVDLIAFNVEYEELLDNRLQDALSYFKSKEHGYEFKAPDRTDDVKRLIDNHRDIKGRVEVYKKDNLLISWALEQYVSDAGRNLRKFLSDKPDYAYEIEFIQMYRPQYQANLVTAQEQLKLLAKEKIIWRV